MKLKSIIMISGLVIFFILNGCSASKSKDDTGNITDDSQTQDTNADTSPVIEKCPDEVDLTKEKLPCDCYGTIATNPAEQVPNCQTYVVCCPNAQGLKCEDYEHDIFQDAQEILPETAEEMSDAPDTSEPDLIDTASIPKCPFEKDLSTVKLPCNCKGTIVYDPKETLPNCKKKVVCCPISGPKCE
jgi:hypothetical protein